MQLFLCCSMPMEDLLSDLTGMQTDYEVTDMNIIDASSFIQNLPNFPNFTQTWDQSYMPLSIRLLSWLGRRCAGKGAHNSGMVYKVIVGQVRERVGRFLWNVVSCPVCAHSVGLAQVSLVVALTFVICFAALSYAASVCRFFFFFQLYRVQDVWKLLQCQLKLQMRENYSSTNWSSRCLKITATLIEAFPHL